MADSDKDNTAGLVKYRYVEEFPESIDPETGKPYEGLGSPKMVQTNFFGRRELHRIAKVKWTETKYTQVYETMGTDGKLEEKEFPVKVYEPEMGELGGWVESKKNLAQEGECWIGDNAVVLDDAEVFGDAKVSGSAEVGEYAVIGGKAEVGGEACVKGYAHVLGDADVSGDKRVAVYDYATIRGTVKSKAVVYGEATVGPYAQASGKAKVYGSAWIEGTEDQGAYIEGEARAFGRAVINGTVGDKCVVYGNAHIGSGGELEDAVYIRNGEVFGLISGNTYLSFAQLYVGKGSQLIYFKTGESRPPLTDKEKKVQRRKDNATSDMVANVWGPYILILTGECKLENCSFSGRVVIEETRAKYCRFHNCDVKNSELYDSAVVTSKMVNFEAKGSAFTESSVGDAEKGSGGKVEDTVVRRGIVQKDVSWNGVTEYGLSSVKEADGVSMSYVTKNELGKKPVAPPYADKQNYDTWQSKGYSFVQVLVKPYERKTEYIVIDGIKYVKNKNSSLLARYRQRQKEIEELAKPIRSQRDQLIKKYDDSGRRWTEEDRVLASRLDTIIHWVEYAFGINYYYLEEDLWEKLKSALSASTNTDALVLHSPYTPLFITERDGFNDRVAVIYDFGKPMDLTPAKSLSVNLEGKYIVVSVDGAYSSWGNKTDYEHYIVNLAGNWSFSSLVEYTLTHDKIYWTYDPTIVRQVNYDDIVEYGKQIRDIKFTGFDPPYQYEDAGLFGVNIEDNEVKGGAWNYYNDIHVVGDEDWETYYDRLRPVVKSGNQKLKDRIQPILTKTKGEIAEGEKRQRELRYKVSDEQKELRKKIEEEKNYVSKREYAVRRVSGCLKSIKVKDGVGQGEAEAISSILGELIYGKPSLEQIESMQKSAEEILSKYQQKVAESSSK